jgi:hypothetical protein
MEVVKVETVSRPLQNKGETVRNQSGSGLQTASEQERLSYHSFDYSIIRPFDYSLSGPALFRTALPVAMRSKPLDSPRSVLADILAVWRCLSPMAMRI